MNFTEKLIKNWHVCKRGMILYHRSKDPSPQKNYDASMLVKTMYLPVLNWTPSSMLLRGKLNMGRGGSVTSRSNMRDSREELLYKRGKFLGSGCSGVTAYIVRHAQSPFTSPCRSSMVQLRTSHVSSCHAQTCDGNTTHRDRITIFGWLTRWECDPGVTILCATRICCCNRISQYSRNSS